MIALLIPESRLVWARRLCRIDELLDLGSLLVHFRQMFGAELLVNRKLLLRVLLLANVHIVRSKAVMGVRKIRIQFESTHIFWNRLLILMLVGIEVSELHMGLGNGVIQGYGLVSRDCTVWRSRLESLDALALP